MNKKVVGGTLNILVHYVDTCASAFLMLSSAIFSNEIVSGSFLIKKVCFCVPTTTAKLILFLNHMNKKVIGGTLNVLVHNIDASAPDPSHVVL